MRHYNRFDLAKEPTSDPDAWIAYTVALSAWGIIAIIAILETFTDLLG